MATAKHSTKSTPKTTKKVTKKKVVASSVKTPAKRKKQTVVVQSFRPSPDETPFFTFKITKQTVYWLILSLIILFIGVWVLKLQSDILYLYDQIDQSVMIHDGI